MVSSGGLEETPSPCLLEFLEATGIPWLMASSSFFKTSHLPISLCLPCIRSLWLQWAHEGNPGQSPHLKILNLTNLQKPFCHVKWHIHRVQGLRHGRLWGPLFYHRNTTKRRPPWNISITIITASNHLTIVWAWEDSTLHPSFHVVLKQHWSWALVRPFHTCWHWSSGRLNDLSSRVPQPWVPSPLTAKAVISNAIREFWLASHGHYNHFLLGLWEHLALIIPPSPVQSDAAPRSRRQPSAQPRPRWVRVTQHLAHLSASLWKGLSPSTFV